jgi:hypothetical protein
MVALLLPDGRVMITGGRAGGGGASPIERASVQILSPPYIFRERPVIVSAPTTMTAGSGLPAPIQIAGAVSEAVLVGLGSMTHSVDMNQRHVELDLVPDKPVFDAVPGFSGGVMPPTVREAPPGYYMLFVLGAGPRRTPSVAKIVRVL